MLSKPNLSPKGPETAPSGERLRAAVLRGAYREVEPILDAFRAEVEARWKAAGSDEERRIIATETTELLRWARQTILAGRSHAQLKLIRYNRERAYLAPGPRKVEHLKLDA